MSNRKRREKRGGMIQINFSMQKLSIMKKVDLRGAEEVVQEENSKILIKLKLWSTKATQNYLFMERKEELSKISHLLKG